MQRNPIEIYSSDVMLIETIHTRCFPHVACLSRYSLLVTHLPLCAVHIHLSPLKTGGERNVEHGELFVAEGDQSPTGRLLFLLLDAASPHLAASPLSAQ